MKSRMRSLRDADEIPLLIRYGGVKVSACHQNRFNKSNNKKSREAV